MSNERLVSEILKQAGVEHKARQPAQIIEMPLRSKFLERTKPVEPEGTEVRTAVAYGIEAGPYISVAVITLLLTLLGLWIYSVERREGILAEIGKTTCSDASLMLEDDPGSDVPRLKDAVLMRCAKAYELF